MSKEAMKLALEALRKSMQGNLVFDEAKEAFKALEKALANQEPPPMECKTDAEKIAYAFGWFKALELNPAQKPWVGLTDDEIDNYFNEEWIGYSSYHNSFKEVMRWQEAKLKEKNT